LLAVAVDLIWGYAGILSLGHGAFFALGGYAMGMYMMRQIGTRGVYADPIRPDFMVFLNWPELPVYWYGFNWFAYAGLMVFLVPAVLAFVFGWFAFRSRVTGVYLSIITQAMTYALLLGFFRNNFGFGGNNGLTDFKDILGFNVQAEATRNSLLVISCLALAISFLICRALVTSKFGKVLVAIRDAEARTRFLGYRVESYKLFVFTLSACMAGVAGALYVPQVGIINPSEFAPANSIEAVIWVARKPFFLTALATSRTPGSPSVWMPALSASRSTPASTSAPKVMSPLIMSLLFFLAITPMGLVRRMFGHAVPKHRDAAAKSYRIASKKANPEDLERPF